MYKCMYMTMHTVHNYAHGTHMCTCPPSHTEPTLTVENLSSLLEGVKDWGNVVKWLHIPHSKQVEMNKQYGGVSKCKQAYCEYWLTHHPSPSWLVVANALYVRKEHEALAVLQKLYLKGKPHAHTCVGALKWELHVYPTSIVIRHYCPTHSHH